MEKRLLKIGSIAVAIVSSALCAAEFELIDSKTDEKGVRICHIKSPYQPEPTLIRILADAAALEARPLRILFVLPVEPREEHRYGDGFEEIRKLAPRGWVVVAPSFAQVPWYADHPSDDGKRHESHFVKAIVPFIDSLFPAESRQRFLLGFSKSGWGAYALLLRHPDLFYAASAWDAPLMKAKPDEFKMQEIFGTQENFERYRIAALLEKNAGMLRARKRLYLAGYGNFLRHTQDAHALMEKLAIPHDYIETPKRKHEWGSGWLSESIAALDALSKIVTVKSN